MSFVPRTDDGTLWALIGTLVAMLLGLEAWSARERARADRARESSTPPGVTPVDAAENGRSQRPE